MKCTKVKNPCKICFQPVSKKTGLRCQGACQKWAHYKCLNYTPGKISDIKAGIIVVTCPCPDCDTAEPKEVLKDPPYTCTNTQCPANKLPICESTECPSKNTIKNTSPIPAYPPPPMEYSPAQSQQQCASNEPPKKTNKCNVKASSSGLSLKMQRRPPSPKPCNTCPNKSFSPKQSQSCSNMSANSCDSGKYVHKLSQCLKVNIFFYIFEFNKILSILFKDVKIYI